MHDMHLTDTEAPLSATSLFSEEHDGLSQETQWEAYMPSVGSSRGQKVNGGRGEGR